jgi:hypothetical protein
MTLIVLNLRSENITHSESSNAVHQNMVAAFAEKGIIFCCTALQLAVVRKREPTATQVSRCMAVATIDLLQ